MSPIAKLLKLVDDCGDVIVTVALMIVTTLVVLALTQFLPC